jgi:hypothetical protein
MKSSASTTSVLSRSERRLYTLVILLASSAAAADEPGFTPLFDGKSLDGWEGNQKIFRVEQGAIVGGSLKAPVARNEFLCTKEQYGDFELRLKFKLLGKGANAGVQLRSQRIPNHHEVKGYQADLGEGWWGALYDESRRNKILIAPKPEVVKEAVKPDDWNDYRIVCQGRQIKLFINDTPMIDYTEPDESIEQRGIIGLQIHGGGPSEAWYKDVRIKKL